MIKNEYIHKGTFEFEAGGSIEGLKVVYHSSERPWQEGDERKVIWICHALTANSDAEDWWPELVGPGKLFDTERYFVVCANMLGSAYGSSGPATENPLTGKPYFFDFPKVTVRDIVRANDLVRQHLGIPHIDFMVGGSIGGLAGLTGISGSGLSGSGLPMGSASRLNHAGMLLKKSAMVFRVFRLLIVPLHLFYVVPFVQVVVGVIALAFSALHQ